MENMEMNQELLDAEVMETVVEATEPSFFEANRETIMVAAGTAIVAGATLVVEHVAIPAVKTAIKWVGDKIDGAKEKRAAKKAARAVAREEVVETEVSPLEDAEK